MRGIPAEVTRESWSPRADDLRTSILACAGLWPEPPRTPLNPRISTCLEGDGFRVSRVVFESWPGIIVTGNLYTPTGNCVTRRAKGREHLRPAVLCPHGHSGEGRLTRDDDFDGPARAVTFARMGYYAFSWDMLGYTDSLQLPHDIGGVLGSEGYAWGVNPLGLQLWNSMRAVDFLLSLPGVDPHRIGCTGESGGATQTLLLTAVDPRVAVSAPVNMVSSRFQGGCVCENAPGLRLDADNVGFAALAAPRPMLLVSCTGDWTSNTPTVEYPAVKRVYDALDSGDNLAWVRVEAPHNYNLESRERVYAWFAHWFGAGNGVHPEYSRLMGGFFERLESGPLLNGNGEFTHTLPERPIQLDTRQMRISPGPMLPKDIPSAPVALGHVIDTRRDSAETALCDLRGFKRALARLCGIPWDWRNRITRDGNYVTAGWVTGGSDSLTVPLHRIPDPLGEGHPHLVVCSRDNHRWLKENGLHRECMGISGDSYFLIPEEVWPAIGAPDTECAERYPECFVPSKGALSVASTIACVHALGQGTGSGVNVTGIGGYGRVSILARALIPEEMSRLTVFLIDPCTDLANVAPCGSPPPDVPLLAGDIPCDIPGFDGIGGIRAALAAGEGCSLALLG